MLARCASVRSTRLLPSMFSRVKASACSRTSSHEATNSATSATLQPIILRPSSEQDCDTAHTDLQLLGGGCGAEDGGGDTGASSTLDTDSRLGFLAAGGESAAVRSSGGGGLVAATEAGGRMEAGVWPPAPGSWPRITESSAWAWAGSRRPGGSSPGGNTGAEPGGVAPGRNQGRAGAGRGRGSPCCSASRDLLVAAAWLSLGSGTSCLLGLGTGSMEAASQGI